MKMNLDFLVGRRCHANARPGIIVGWREHKAGEKLLVLCEKGKLTWCSPYGVTVSVQDYGTKWYPKFKVR